MIISKTRLTNHFNLCIYSWPRHLQLWCVWSNGRWVLMCLQGIVEVCFDNNDILVITLIQSMTSNAYRQTRYDKILIILSVCWYVGLSSSDCRYFMFEINFFYVLRHSMRMSQVTNEPLLPTAAAANNYYYFCSTLRYSYNGSIYIFGPVDFEVSPSTLPLSSNLLSQYSIFRI